jgi:hypothetical protein
MQTRCRDTHMRFSRARAHTHTHANTHTNRYAHMPHSNLSTLSFIHISVQIFRVHVHYSVATLLRLYAHSITHVHTYACTYIHMYIHTSIVVVLECVSPGRELTRHLMSREEVTKSSGHVHVCHHQALHDSARDLYVSVSVILIDPCMYILHDGASVIVPYTSAMQDVTYPSENLHAHIYITHHLQPYIHNTYENGAREGWASVEL